jgi:hypothetical protein
MYTVIIETLDSGANSASPAQFTVSQDTNCRYGPSSSAFDIRQTIFAGESVPIVGVGKPPAQEWWVVTVNGMECWVWKETGQTSGDTGSVLAVNPPAMPEQANDGNGGQNQDNGGNNNEGQDASEETTCEYYYDNPSTMIVTPDPAGRPGITISFTITGFQPNVQSDFYITRMADGEIAYHTLFTTNGNGSATIKLNTEASDEPGQYMAEAFWFCSEANPIGTTAVFIIE